MNKLLLHPATKPLVFVVCLLPFAWLFYLALTDGLGANPAEQLIRSTGDFPRLLNSHAGWGIMWVYVWKQTPFMAMVIFSVLLGVGRDTEEAALMLGANRRQVFWNVTLPQIMPGIVSASLIVFAFNFGSFEAPILLGAGYPNTLPVEAWRAFDDPDYARRLSSMAIVTFVALVSSAVLFAYITLYRRFERRRGRV